MSRHKLVYICDWLPPDFGAVGQYSLGFARERAAGGEDVLLAGLSSTIDSTEVQQMGSGRLTVRRFRARPYDRSRFARRALWTLGVNLRLVWRLWTALRQADEILFTGSPPYMLHFLASANLLLRKRLVYRITDFHPECLMAGRERNPLALRMLYRLTVARRRRIDRFEALGEDQRRRLVEIGIDANRITLKRDPSPVSIPPETRPLPRPAELDGSVLLLYSGNFGHAHDHQTFVEGYRRHHHEGSGRVALWLNAVGSKADLVEQQLRQHDLPIFRSRPGPLDQLPRLLTTPDAHLITLRDPFVGLVMPSKVYGCIESTRDIVYVGSPESDVHLLCAEHLPQTAYHHVSAGDAQGMLETLENLADRMDGQRRVTAPAARPVTLGSRTA